MWHQNSDKTFPDSKITATTSPCHWTQLEYTIHNLQKKILVYFIFTFCWIIFNWLLEQSDILKSAQEQNHFFMLISYRSNLHVEPNWGSWSREKGDVGVWCSTTLPQPNTEYFIHHMIHTLFRITLRYFYMSRTFNFTSSTENNTFLFFTDSLKRRKATKLTSW